MSSKTGIHGARSGAVQSVLSGPLVFLVLAALWGAPTAGHAQVRRVDQAAAVVNGQLITLSELKRRIGPDLERLSREGRGTTEVRNQLMRRALDDLIADQLLAAEQKELGIEITEADVDLAVEDVRKQNRMDAATFERALMAQNLSLSEYRDRIRRELASMKLLGQKVRSKIKVSDEDVRAEWMRRTNLEQTEFEVRARQIVVQVAADAESKVDEAAREKAAELMRRARAGEDFAELARKYSDSPSKAEGGDVGFFKRGEMIGPFDRAAFSLSPGQVSEPFRTSFGWHVIEVTERRPIETASFEEMKAEVTERLIRERMQAQTDLYLNGLRQKASVEILLPELK